MAMFPALMNDTMFSDLFDDPFFELAQHGQRDERCDACQHDDHRCARDR